MFLCKLYIFHRLHHSSLPQTGNTFALVSNPFFQVSLGLQLNSKSFPSGYFLFPDLIRRQFQSSSCTTNCHSTSASIHKAFTFPKVKHAPTQQDHVQVLCDALLHNAFYILYHQQPHCIQSYNRDSCMGLITITSQSVIGHSGSNYGQGSDGHLTPSLRDATAGTRAEDGMKSFPTHYASGLWFTSLSLPTITLKHLLKSHQPSISAGFSHQGADLSIA